MDKVIDTAQLKAYADGIGVALEEGMLGQFDRYAEILLDWNSRMNLTAITKPEEMVVKHFVDSLTLLTVLKVPQGAKGIDVGTGAGFPGVPVKIARPDVQLTLLDSLNKRVNFLQALSQALGQENLCLHARAEEAGRKDGMREQYDFATARAVAHLRELSEYCLPFVRAGGYFAAMKSGQAEQELEEAKAAIRLLGGKVEQVEKMQLPDGSGRSIILIKKISQISSKYPRPSAKIAKFPLNGG